MSQLTENSKFKDILAAADKARDLKEKSKDILETRVDQIIDIAKTQINPKLIVQLAYAEYINEKLENPEYESDALISGAATIELPEHLVISIRNNPLQVFEKTKIQQSLSNVLIEEYTFQNHYERIIESKREIKPDVTSEYGTVDVTYRFNLERLRPLMEMGDDTINRIVPRPVFDEVEEELGVYYQPVSDYHNGVFDITNADIDAAKQRGRISNDIYVDDDTFKISETNRFVLREPHLYKDPELDLSDLRDNELEM